MDYENHHNWPQDSWEAELAAQPDISSGVSAFLAWLMLWFRLCVDRSQRRTWRAPVRAYAPNRFWRRYGERDVAPVHNNRPYYILTGRNLTPGQFMEWLARYSGRGRVRVYRMRYWRKTVKGKAAPLGTEHEYWRDPLEHIGSRMAKLPSGVWHAHIWPGWHGLPDDLNTITPMKTSRVDNGLWTFLHSRKHLNFTVDSPFIFISKFWHKACINPYETIWMCGAVPLRPKQGQILCQTISPRNYRKPPGRPYSRSRRAARFVRADRCYCSYGV